MANNLKNFCYQTSRLIMAGLEQELGLQPDQHYQPRAHNAARVLSLRLCGINPHYLKRIQSLQAELTMWAGLSNKTKIRIGWDQHSIIVEIPKPEDYQTRVTLDLLSRRHLLRAGTTGLVTTLGLGLQDEPRRIDFSEPAIAHLFIAGQPRCGKTNAQQLIAWNIAHNVSPDQAQMLIFEVAKRGYRWKTFDRLAHLSHPVITEIEEANRVLAWLAREEMKNRSIKGYTTPKYFVMVDELKALTDDSQLAVDHLSRLASLGGEFGIHLILATQYPQINLLKSAEIKLNVTTRLCGQVVNAASASNAMGIPRSGAELLQGHGDFLLKTPDGLHRLTVACLQPRDLDCLPRADIRFLDLPDPDRLTNGLPPPSREPDPPEPDQVALALFQPQGINRLASHLSIGSTKATRIKSFADRIRTWAIEHGHQSIPLEGA